MYRFHRYIRCAEPLPLATFAGEGWASHSTPEWAPGRYTAQLSERDAQGGAGVISVHILWHSIYIRQDSSSAWSCACKGSSSSSFNVKAIFRSISKLMKEGSNKVQKIRRRRCDHGETKFIYPPYQVSLMKLAVDNFLPQSWRHWHTLRKPMGNDWCSKAS